ncbi:hypothetical protein ACFVUB_17865 [Streptomyces niveus]|uniref:hypothetical protein n=1 Tax=Streptomyces niveus TaxID=193462 RepID=UPI0036DAA093
MMLNPDERRLLELVAQTREPVAMSDYFHEIHPPNFSRDAAEDDPARVTWTELQMSLYRASLKLWESGLVQVVHPANGERPDLVSVTDAGHSELA